MPVVTLKLAVLRKAKATPTLDRVPSGNRRTSSDCKVSMYWLSLDKPTSYED